MSPRQALDHRPAARPRARAVRRAAVLLAGAAWLAGVPRAPAQGYTVVPPALLNEEEIGRELSTALPDRPTSDAPAVSVDLTFRVRADGTLDPTTVSVERALNAAFATRAVAVARKMRFAPARVSGTPAAVWYHYTLIFRYADPGADGVTGGGTYEISAVETPPRLLNGGWAAREIARRYPPAQRDAGTPGDVVVRFRVRADGDVDSATVAAEASTDTAFEAPAVAVIRHMRFSPALVGGRAVRVWVSIPIHFELQGDAPADSAAKTRPLAAPPAAPARPMGSVRGRGRSGTLAGGSGRRPGGPFIRRPEARA
ncbi:MAG TPA: TonB family protein [Longimicrobium sp.]|nr:TonB family protein [Longimicrobium sp.]